MWSVGVILAEMLGRRPMFPGHNRQEMLVLIFKVLGNLPFDQV
jgi:hypothetical protein